MKSCVPVLDSPKTREISMSNHPSTYGLNLVPVVVEQTSRGERAYDI